MKVKEIEVLGGFFKKEKEKRDLHGTYQLSSEMITLINQLPFTSLRYQWMG
jgi:hypothetical protein